MTDGERPKIYVAGPYGFTSAGWTELVGEVLPALAAAGFEALDPWVTGGEVLGPALSAEPRDQDAVRIACAEVGRANEAMIRDADGVLAQLDGCDLDSGTAAEVGFAAALGIPVVGLRTDTRRCGDVAEIPINLQVLHFVEVTGGSLHTTLGDAIAELVDLAGAR